MRFIILILTILAQAFRVKDDVAEISYRVTSGVGIPTFSRYTDRLGKLAGILLL